MARRKTLPKSRKTPKKSPQRRSLKAPSNIGRDFEKLVHVMARLRAPGGCPWDREQTHATLRTYLIEEAYEVLDALDSTDDSKFAEELGDLLLQVLFHAQIAHEEHRFSITDVIGEIHAKMVRRHPHVFGDTTAKTAADVLRNWEIIKKEERAAKSNAGISDSRGGTASSSAFSAKGGASPEARQATPPTAADDSVSILDGVPRTLPALLEALQLTRKAARIGFDWPNVDGIFAKLTEETHELQKALGGQSFRSDGSSSQKRGASGSEELRSNQIEAEVGDLLFVLVNLARFLHVDPELALKKTSAKFTRRFRQVEQFAREENTTLAQIRRDHLESLWDRAKLLE